MRRLSNLASCIPWYVSCKALSILKHGMLLKQGDYLNDGTVLSAAHHFRKDGENSYVWTHPERKIAFQNSNAEKYDNGKTEICVVLKIRQKDGTFTKISNGFYKTEHRDTMVFERLDVYMPKSLKKESALSSLEVDLPMTISKFPCPVQQKAYEYLVSLHFPQQIFNAAYNRCYCKSCFPHEFETMDVAGEKYIIPKGWVRFGLLINPVLTKLNEVWDNWAIAFHGCSADKVLSIIKHRTLLIPSDKTMDGVKLETCASRDSNQKKYFLSPYVEYSAHPWYAAPVEMQFGKETFWGQTIIQFKVNI